VAVVDYERAWYALKARVAERSASGGRSWGASQIAESMAEIEVECLVPESERDFDLTPPRSRDSTGSKPATSQAA